MKWVTPMMDWGYMGTGGVLMAVTMVAGVLLLIALVVAAVAMVTPGRWARESTAGQGEPRSPAETEIELRYARGEIDAATLAEQRAVIRRR